MRADNKGILLNQRSHMHSETAAADTHALTRPNWIFMTFVIALPFLLHDDRPCQV